MRILQIASSFSLVLGFVACGGDGDDQGTPDAPGGTDGPGIDASPTAITITGTATGRQGLSAPAPVVGATIAGYRHSDESAPIAMATTGTDGTFTLTLETGGAALDGYLKASREGFKETYLYPNVPISTDTAAPIIMLDQAAYGLVSQSALVTQQAGNGLVALVVFDGTSSTAMPVTGATISVDPEIAATEYRYNENGRPSGTAQVTSGDGVAYVFNAPPDVSITVSAAKTGTTFQTHGLKARAGQFTTTFITP